MVIQSARKELRDSFYRQVGFYVSLMLGRAGSRVRKLILGGGVKLDGSVMIDELVSIRGVKT